jgi:hypothetical protein
MARYVVWAVAHCFRECSDRYRIKLFVWSAAMPNRESDRSNNQDDHAANYK